MLIIIILPTHSMEKSIFDLFWKKITLIFLSQTNDVCVVAYGQYLFAVLHMKS